MKFLIIGHTVEDHIFYRGRNQQVKPGGIYYAAAGMHYFKSDEDEIFLASSIEDENYYLFRDVYDGINKKYLYKVPAIPKVHLNVFDNKERHEHYENITDKLEIDFSCLNEFDGIFINIVTGFDISAEDIINIRKHYSGKIYIDIHSLSRGLEPNYVRNFRPIPDVDKWLSSVDILQANENEILTLSKYKDELSIAKELFSHGIKIFINTKGDKGTTLISSEETGISVFDVPPINIKTENRIGCGDVFGAVFFYSYIKFGDKIKALNLANIAGGCIASYQNINQMKSLKKDVFSRYT